MIKSQFQLTSNKAETLLIDTHKRNENGRKLTLQPILEPNGSHLGACYLTKIMSDPKCTTLEVKTTTPRLKKFCVNKSMEHYKYTIRNCITKYILDYKFWSLIGIMLSISKKRGMSDIKYYVFNFFKKYINIG